MDVDQKLPHASSMVGKKSFSLRELKCDLGGLFRCDGSASFSVGDTAVLAGLFGPVDLKVSLQLFDRALVQVKYSAKTAGSGTQQQSAAIAIEECIRECIEQTALLRLFPRACIELTVQELHDDGGVDVACINSACLALLDAGLPLKATFAAVKCCVLSDTRVVVDPRAEVERQARATVVVVFESREDKVLVCRTSGLVTEAQLEESLAVAKLAARRVFAFYRTALARKYVRDCDFRSRPSFV